ncbi:hypothetical protein HCB45_13270 [Listeria sp. FSL L7-0091]|uniref:hypothetical protein n=1 Tax=Listeria farberi TaxID=2713500 RepID=UPI0016277D66|nr:hypothetical protein [Listeria farberi]MBC2262549.1 hypothetical protein [Listeria farberi]
MNKNTIKDLILSIEQRPTMFLRNKTIDALSDFLNGYLMGCRKEIMKGYSIDFWFFHEFIKNYYNYSYSTSGWTNMILEHCCDDQEKAFHVFFQRYHEFMKISVESVYKADLKESNSIFHFDMTKGKNLVVNLDLEQLEPVYKNPKSYIVLKLSLNNGFILLVESNNLFYQERKLFKNLSEIDHEISSLFGTVQQLHPIAIETLNNLEYYT